VKRQVCGSPRIALAAALLIGCDVRIYPFGAASPELDASIPIVCPDELSGFATGTTGGGSESPVVVSASSPDALSEFAAYASDKMPGPLVIQIRGMISFAGFADSQVKVSSDKTVVGADASSGFSGGGLDLTGSSDVIIKNLVISRALGTDAITLNASTGIWIDHCDLSSDRAADAGSYDGLVDITHASDFVTVSWTHFHDHDDTGIVGHSVNNGTQDTGHLTVTYHHDLFTNVNVGPRVRFGSVHVYDLVFSAANYGVISQEMASVLVEESSFEHVATAPVTTIYQDPEPGFAWMLNDVVDASGPSVTSPPPVWSPPYAYLPDSAATARTLTSACAGPRASP
jgi:pectate lyase